MARFTRRGRPLLVYEDYSYTKDYEHTNKNNTKITYWKCERRETCRARIRTDDSGCVISLTNLHTHDAHSDVPARPRCFSRKYRKQYSKKVVAAIEDVVDKAVGEMLDPFASYSLAGNSSRRQDDRDGVISREASYSPELTDGNLLTSGYAGESFDRASHQRSFPQTESVPQPFGMSSIISLAASCSAKDEEKPKMKPSSEVLLPTGLAQEGSSAVDHPLLDAEIGGQAIVFERQVSDRGDTFSSEFQEEAVSLPIQSSVPSSEVVSIAPGHVVGAEAECVEQSAIVGAESECVQKSAIEVPASTAKDAEPDCVGNVTMIVEAPVTSGENHEVKVPAMTAPAVMPSEEYVVERIVGKQNINGVLYYLIKWQGYPDTSNTWEPRANCTSCPELIEEFEQRHRSTLDIKTGFEKGYKADRVLGTAEIGGELMYLVKFCEKENPELIPACIVNIKCPQTVIAFYESRVKWESF